MKITVTIKEHPGGKMEFGAEYPPGMVTAREQRFARMMIDAIKERFHRIAADGEGVIIAEGEHTIPNNRN